jgi:hypothetical protein
MNGLERLFGGDSQAKEVPPVDAADIRSTWMMQNKYQAFFPEGIMIPAETFKQACQAGADVRAVFERVSQIGYLQMAEVLEPWLQDGVPKDAVFEALATVPMSRMQVGVVYDKPPFDVDEFVKLVQRLTRSNG